MKRRSQPKQRKAIKSALKGNSQYKRKREYCRKNGVWGFEVKDKPWK